VQRCPMLKVGTASAGHHRAGQNTVDLDAVGDAPIRKSLGERYDRRVDRPDGVQVNSVLPGPVMTGRRRSYLAHWAPLHYMTVEEATAKFPQEAGIARYGEPEEIAELMAFLVSPPARWMTGSTLRMDGGEVKSV
jgi:NAD(P)-dependent dehydrogenase (short-subunit alcohol dehydrogenase family)